MAPDLDKALEYFEKSCRGGLAGWLPFSVAVLYGRRQDRLTARPVASAGVEISQRYAQAEMFYI